MSIQHIRENEPIKTMSLADLAERVKQDIPNEHTMSVILQRVAVLANDAKMPALGLLFNVLAEEPAECAAGWKVQVQALANLLHADTEGPALCRVVSLALAQFEEDKNPSECDACSNEATHVNGPGGNRPVGQWCDSCDTSES